MQEVNYLKLFVKWIVTHTSLFKALKEQKHHIYYPSMMEAVDTSSFIDIRAHAYSPTHPRSYNVDVNANNPLL